MSKITPQPGSLIGGKYRVERLLGEGGMGAVFSAIHTLSGKQVAIKWMHPDVAAHPDSRQRFLREAQASARVRHPNVVDVYDVLEEGDSLFLVMEFLEGESLSDLMSREGTPITELLALVVSAMRGVAAAHRQGVVHRDIKPDNIFLARIGDDGRPVPKVLDFGISKLTGANDPSITKTGMALGTPLYMSVEQLSGVRDIDARTDIYAFGVILYQAVTGQPPFDADSFPVLIAKIMTEEAPSPKLLRPEMPNTLSRLIEWAMAKDRDQRVSTIDELIRELEPFASDAGFRSQMTIGSSDIPNVVTPSSRPANHVLPVSERPVPSTPRRAMAVVSLGLLLVAVAAWWFTSTPTPPIAAREPKAVLPSAAPRAPATSAHVVTEPVVAPPPPVQPASTAEVRQERVRVAAPTKVKRRAGAPAAATSASASTPETPAATPQGFRAGAPRREDF